MFKKAVIVTSQRSGSGYLQTLLDSHTKAQFYPEIFLSHADEPYGFANFLHQKTNSKKKVDQIINSKFTKYHLNFRNQYYTQRYLNYFENQAWEYSKTHKKQASVIGFKVMYSELKKNKTLVKWLQKNNVAIVHLYRSNVLEMLISRAIKEKQKVAHATKYDALDKSIQVTFNMDNLFNDIQYMDQLVKKWRLLLKTNALEVSYEDLVSKPQEVNRVLNFLGLPEEKLQSELIKMNKKPMHQTIENYAEIVKVLEHTEYAWMLSH